METILKESVEILKEILLFLNKVTDKTFELEMKNLKKKVEGHLSKTEQSLKAKNESASVDDDNYNDVVVDQDEDYNDVEIEGDNEVYADTVADTEEDSVYESSDAFVSQGLSRGTENSKKKAHQKSSAESDSSRARINKQLKMVGSTLKTSKQFMKTKGSKLKANISSTLERNKSTKTAEGEEIYVDTASESGDLASDKNIDDYIDVEVKGPAKNAKAHSTEKGVGKVLKTKPNVSALFSKKIQKEKSVPSVTPEIKANMANAVDSLLGKNELKKSETTISIPENEKSAKTNPSFLVIETDNLSDHEEDDLFKNVVIDDLYQGMWDCQADENNELSFKRGQIVHIISKEYDCDGWWIGKRKEKIGFVPKNYLMEAYEK